MLVRHASRRVARPLASYARAMSTTKYRTTRGAQKDVDFASAVLQGLGADGGLFVPQDLPKISAAELESWRSATYEDVAYGVMSKYITEDVMPAAKLKDIIKRSYGTFRPPSDDPITPGDHTDGKHGRVTPVRELPGDNMHVLELYHGPTFAFKDVALQFLGNLFEALLEDRPGMRITVLGATSGDTGSSAIHGLRGKKNVECFIMYPEGRTSRTQELQMISVVDENIHNIALRGTFDDCQATVKACFNDHAFNKEISIAAVNSINWARILAQMVYYVHAYLKVTKPGSGEKVSFSVPTGNFGDILAGFYAKKMGLPVDQLIVATNQNDILHRFFGSNGDYTLDKNGVAETISPSMDIGVSSNFERFLFHMGGDDAAQMKALMDNFEKSGALNPPDALVSACSAEMDSASVTDPEILVEINETYKKSGGYVLDPHSAIGVAAARKARTPGSTTPMICLAFAHWAKFPDANKAAIGAEAAKSLTVPEPLASLHTLPTRVSSQPYDVKTVQGFIKETLSGRGVL